MNREFSDAIEASPIIAAIKDDDGLSHCLATDSRIIFILYGDLISTPRIVAQIKETGKMAMVHIDLIHGLQAKEIAVDFIKTYTNADGIISTKANLISHARELGLATVMRFFLIDSMAYDSILRQLPTARPDVIEILPGPMPKLISRIKSQIRLPLICGGLVSDKEDVVSILSAGADAISSTRETVWFL